MLLMSLAAHHTSHITRHTSHITHHTSHVTRQLYALQLQRLHCGHSKSWT